MKTTLQRFLKSVGLYQRLRSSLAYDIYWRFAEPSLIERRNREVEFYRRTLTNFKPGDLIFDIGANQGAKTDVFLRLGARVVAVDPDPTNQKTLRERFLSFRTHPKVTVLGKAAGANSGTEVMWIDEPGSAKNTLSSKWVDTLRTDEGRFGHRLGFSNQMRVEVTTVDQMITDYGPPLFIKIDVEGYELGVLAGMSHPVPFLSFEVNLPEFRAEGLQCIELLDKLDAKGEFSFAVECCDGFAIPDWVSAGEFYRILSECSEPSIEVFWKRSSNSQACSYTCRAENVSNL